MKKKILTNSYWNKFYKDFKLEKPSNFTKFVKKKIKKITIQNHPTVILK